MVCWPANTLFFLLQKQTDTAADCLCPCNAMLFTVRQQLGIGTLVKTYLQIYVERIFYFWPPCAWAHFITYFLHSHIHSNRWNTKSQGFFQIPRKELRNGKIYSIIGGSERGLATWNSMRSRRRGRCWTSRGTSGSRGMPSGFCLFTAEIKLRSPPCGSRSGTSTW